MVIIIVIAARLHETAESEADKLLRSCARWACADVTWTCCLNFAPEGDTDTVTRWRGRWQVASGSQQPAGSMQHAAQASCQSPIDCWQSPFAWHLHCKTPLTCSSSNCCLTLTISGHTHTHTHTQSHSQVSCNTCTALLQRWRCPWNAQRCAAHTARCTLSRKCLASCCCYTRCCCLSCSLLSCLLSFHVNLLLLFEQHCNMCPLHRIDIELIAHYQKHLLKLSKCNQKHRILNLIKLEPEMKQQ